MKKLAILLLCVLSACAPSPRQQSLQIAEAGQKANVVCADKKSETDKTKCDWEIVSAKAKEINYPYYDILENSYENDIYLAERYDSKKITKKQYEQGKTSFAISSYNLIMARIVADEHDSAVLSAKLAAAGQILGNTGANMSAASAPSRLPNGAYELPNNTINCTSYRQGYYTNTNCR